ncbi:MAG: prepilin-type N-terminal cleavage/methylation domain-containing protein [Candidatus Omnitrophica bacterium]|nr:prepilin-type N-terminal cleavage/methylation domain-containing protein [Candidatus Omnitrophota bacterium]
MNEKSFTLLELMLVVVILGILATFVVPGYLGVKRRAEGRGSSTQLRMLHAAQKVNHLEEELYIACNGFAACNTALDLDLPDDGWAYRAVCIGGCANGFLARATDTSGSGCVYTITQLITVPTTGASCVFTAR